MSRIHTLNARGNLLFATIREFYSWTDERTFVEVQRTHQDFLKILSDKGINCDELRTALTPQTNKHEAAFLFDEHRCNSERIAGVDAADAVFKLLRSKIRSSYLYSLDWRNVPATDTSAGYKGSFFNVMLEFPREAGEPERVTVALEYKPSSKVLRVVTMT